MNEAPSTLPDMDALRASGAALVDAVGWHYIERLAERTQTQSGQARLLLQAKLQEALLRFDVRMSTAGKPKAAPTLVLSPLATLLQDMGSKSPPQAAHETQVWRAENPRIQQFRKQLSKISVQKQVKQAIAQAPQNAGPINSHMLVLRSLGLMRDISPDYLNRFMAHVDTLLCLDAADRSKPVVKKSASAQKPIKK